MCKCILLSNFKIKRLTKLQFVQSDKYLLENTKNYERQQVTYSLKIFIIKLTVRSVYCVSYLSWKIGHFRTDNDSPITSNEKLQNYTLVPILFDYILLKYFNSS